MIRRRDSPMTIWIESVPMAEEPRWSQTPEGLRTPHPYRRVRRDEEAPVCAVFLAPACAADDSGRAWAEDDAWGKCPDCGARAVTYAPVWDWLRKPEAWRVTA